MKKEVMFLLLFCLIGIKVCISQTLEPFKKANTIIIETNMKADSAYMLWGRHLAQNGYGIEKSDNLLYSLTTAPKDASKYNYDFITHSVVLNNGSIKVKIKWRVKSSFLAGSNSTEYYDWSYAMSSMNNMTIIQGDVLKAIKSFGNFVVKYSIE